MKRCKLYINDVSWTNCLYSVKNNVLHIEWTDNDHLEFLRMRKSLIGIVNTIKLVQDDKVFIMTTNCLAHTFEQSNLIPGQVAYYFIGDFFVTKCRYGAFHALEH